MLTPPLGFTLATQAGLAQKTSTGCCSWRGLLRREEIGCLTVKITSFRRAYSKGAT
jgi:hypothetical protein